MKKTSFVAAIAAAFATVTLPLTAVSATAAPISHFSYEGYTDLANATVLEENKAEIEKFKLGGLSGIDRYGEELFAISDDKENTRVYKMHEEGDNVVVDGVIPLLDDNGAPVKDVDAEEIRMLDDHTFAWTDEGYASPVKEGDEEGPRVPPRIRISTTDGHEVSEIPVPDYHVPDADSTRGVRFNKGPEAMTIRGNQLITVNEAALAQDGPLNDEQHGMRTRVTVYDLDTKQATAEYVLDVNPLYPGAGDRGIPSIVADDEGNLYVLERGYIKGTGNRGEIYRINLDGATNVLGKEALDGSEKPVGKDLVFDFAGNKEHPDNIEGMTWAKTDDGAPRELLVISDNNFSDSQRTLLHTLKESDVPQEPAAPDAPAGMGSSLLGSSVVGSSLPALAALGSSK